MFVPVCHGQRGRIGRISVSNQLGLLTTQTFLPFGIDVPCAHTLQYDGREVEAGGKAPHVPTHVC